MPERATAPVVSIGLPVYNGEAYLGDTVESLLTQSLTDLELIISDNGSTDATQSICRDLAAADERIRYVRHEQNRGAAWNYNHTVDLARGRYFMWTGYDDLRHPTHLERCVEQLEAGGPDLVLAYPRTQLIDDQGDVLRDYHDGLHLPQPTASERTRDLLRNLGLANAVFGLIRLDALRRTRLIRPFVSSDLVLLYELALIGRFHEIPERLFSRRIHAEMSQQANATAQSRLAWFTGTPTSKQIMLPRTRLFVEMVRVTLAAPLSPLDRGRCLGRLAQLWGPKYLKLAIDELAAATVALSGRALSGLSRRGSAGPGAEPGRPLTATPLASDPIVDRFADVGLPPVGGVTDSGHRRLGADPEGTLSIDESGLRIAPLAQPGWGRSCVAYGPVEPAPGLVLMVHVLNGHQASQTYTLRRLLPRLREWLAGSGETGPRGQRLRRLLLDGRRVSSGRRVREWIAMTGAPDSPWARRLPPLARYRAGHGRRPPITDNLVVGLLSRPVAEGPEDIESGFVVRSASSLSGELLAAHLAGSTSAIERLGAVPLHLAVICREDSTLFAASSVAGARGLPEPPRFRPLAVGPPCTRSQVYAAVQQNVSGEIGFSVDTRVFGLAVVPAPELSDRFAGAHLADTFVAVTPVGDRQLSDDPPLLGPRWQMASGSVRRTSNGAVGEDDAVAITDPGAPTGLLRLCTGAEPLQVAVLWRYSGSDDHWRLELDGQRFRLGRRVGGHDGWLESGLLPAASSIEVCDDNQHIRIVADGEVLITVPLPPATGEETPTAVGVAALRAGCFGVTALEALPRQIELAPDLVLEPAADLRGPVETVVDDDFSAEDGSRLEGRTAGDGLVWRRALGTGDFVIRQPGRLVIESCPDRTAFTMPWAEPGLADLSAVIEPSHHRGAMCRAGLIAMQDDQNYLSINLWFNDRSDGAASVSTFLMLDGHEDVYDAVWVNVGDRIGWDRPVTLRLVFDGRLYQVSLDDEPVLWRRIDDVYPAADRLRVDQIGLLANWEWGLDTGSVIHRFTASRRRSSR